MTTNISPAELEPLMTIEALSEYLDVPVTNDPGLAYTRHISDDPREVCSGIWLTRNTMGSPLI